MEDALWASNRFSLCFISSICTLRLSTSFTLEVTVVI